MKYESFDKITNNLKCTPFTRLHTICFFIFELKQYNIVEYMTNS